MDFLDKFFVKTDSEQEPNIGRSLEKDGAIDTIFENGLIQSRTTLHFDCGKEIGCELKPGHRLAFVVPEEFRDRIVRDVILQHRKDEKYRKDIGPDRFDPYGAYNRVELSDIESQKWIGWKDPKGRGTDKFAEPRFSGSPEHEILHDWIATVGEVKPDAVRITNVGKNKEYAIAQVHGLQVVFFPDLQNVEFDEHIFCPGTRSIDLEKKEFLPSYGGGSRTEGIYEGAIALNQRERARYRLTEELGGGIVKEGRDLLIALNEGSLVQVEVSLGDTENLDHINPKTGRHTRLGYAKLWVGVRRTDGTINWFIENTNVPPQGVLAGGPKLEHEKIEAGDELIIRSENDTTYIMGWRLAYAKNALEKAT